MLVESGTSNKKSRRGISGFVGVKHFFIFRELLPFKSTNQANNQPITVTHTILKCQNCFQPPPSPLASLQYNKLCKTMFKCEMWHWKIFSRGYADWFYVVLLSISFSLYFYQYKLLILWYGMAMSKHVLTLLQIFLFQNPLPRTFIFIIMQSNKHYSIE